MSRTRSPRPRRAREPLAARLLPAALLQFPVERLALPAPTAEQLQQHGIATLGDLLRLPAAQSSSRGWLASDHVDALRRALALVVRDGVATADPAASQGAFRDLRDELFAGLSADERELLAELLGFDGPPLPRLDVARRRGMPAHTIDELAERVRARLHQTAPALLGRLRYEVGRDLAAAGGMLAAAQTSSGTLLQLVAVGSGDARLGARLCAFCFQREFTLHRDHLCAVAPRVLRRLLRVLPTVVSPQRLPLPVAAIEAELAGDQLAVPREVLVHLLRIELRLEVETDAQGEQIVVPDQRGPSARLVDLLLDLGRATSFEELVYAYRERFRRAPRRRLGQLLRSNPVFVQLGRSTWSLRRWHKDELAAVAPLVDRVARRIAVADGRQTVAALLADEQADERTEYLVLDRLAVDPRVRLLGRGELCPATHQQSRVLAQLLADFRRAAGDVVTSLFVQNQPPARRRLVARLLRHNRLFVTTAPDRVDVLTNYPFNAERMRRLVNLVGHQIEQAGGRVPILALKQLLDGTDLGGEWLSPTLLADLLRRHGQFELLGDELVCRPGEHVGAGLLRTVRQALREAAVPLSVDEILTARPELSEFAGCLHDLIATDPLLQTPDGERFTLV